MMFQLTDVIQDVSDLKFGRRQMPMGTGDKELLLIMDLHSCLTFDRSHVPGKELNKFIRKYDSLESTEIRDALTVPLSKFMSLLSQCIPCVGCRRSVEQIYKMIMNSEDVSLDPLHPIKIERNGDLTVSSEIIDIPQIICTLFYNHEKHIETAVESQGRNKKNSRCGLHTLDVLRPRLLSDMWREVWDNMNKQCREKITMIEISELQLTVDVYLKKHKFCNECRTKVEKAFNLLLKDNNRIKEKGFVPKLYANIKKNNSNKSISLLTKTDFIDSLIRRAEPDFNGRHRERHAKTLEIAQEEVLICIGMCLYVRLTRIYAAYWEEMNACQVLAVVAAHALCQNFETAVEEKQGITNLELLLRNIEFEEKLKEQKRNAKKLKKKRKRHEKRMLEEKSSSCHSCGPECDEHDDIDELDFDIPYHNCNHSKIDIDEKDDIRNSKNRKVGNIDHQSKTIGTKDVIVQSVCNTYGDESDSRLKSSILSSSNDTSYSTDNVSHRCCSEANSLSSEFNSHTSSLTSSPASSEVACSDGLCNHDNMHSKQVTGNKYSTNINLDHWNFCDTVCTTSDGLPLSLQQMLLDPMLETHENDENIPAEVLADYEHRQETIKKCREELRRNLRRNFEQFRWRQLNIKN